MKTNHNKWLWGLVAIGFGLAASISGQEGEGAGDKAAPTKLVETIPAPAYWLFQCPDQSVLEGPKRVGNDADKVVWPKKQCLGWLKKVLAPAWGPPKGATPIFIASEFDGRDVVRMAWEQKGYNIQVSQTASIFTIKLSPVDGKPTGVDAAQKIETARQLCLQVFAATGRRWGQDETGGGIEVPVNNLSTKISAWSFRPELARHLKGDGAVRGRPQRAHEASVRQPRNDDERLRERDPNNANWDQSWVSYAYWFRKVNWWNDGRSVGFYFLKVEEGAWVPSYDAKFDKTFFRE